MKRSFSPNHPARQLARGLLNRDPNAELEIMEMSSGNPNIIMKLNMILAKTGTVRDGDEAKVKGKLNGDIVEFTVKSNTILREERKRPVNDEQNDRGLMENTNTNTSPQSQPLPMAGVSGSKPLIVEEKINSNLDLEEAQIFCNKVRDYLCNEENHLQFLRILYYYSIEKIEKKDMRNMISELLENNQKLMEEFDELIDHYSNQSDPEEKKEDGPEQNEPTEEEISNPSYDCLPASKRPKLESEVLNTEWALKPLIESEPKETSERKQFRKDWEDDLWMHDMVRENLKSTLEKTKRLIIEICDKKLKLQPPIKAENYLNRHNLNCIKQLYGKHGADILDLLATIPHKTLPVILLRLDQKVEEFETRHRSRIDELWRKANANNLP